MSNRIAGQASNAAAGVGDRLTVGCGRSNQTFPASQFLTQSCRIRAALMAWSGGGERASGGRQLRMVGDRDGWGWVEQRADRKSRRRVERNKLAGSDRMAAVIISWWWWLERPGDRVRSDQVQIRSPRRRWGSVRRFNSPTMRGPPSVCADPSMALGCATNPGKHIGDALPAQQQ